jgi:hypothetical protein
MGIAMIAKIAEIETWNRKKKFFTMAFQEKSAFIRVYPR